MEDGPRALGSREHPRGSSRPGDARQINALVKKREGVPAVRPCRHRGRRVDVLRHREGEEDTFAHMLLVTQVRPAFRDQLPAITHVDGSARVQTVSRENYPRFWELLRAFEALTGFPILLNTSFNVKGQPIVAPGGGTGYVPVRELDLLVIDDFLVSPRPGKEVSRTVRPRRAHFDRSRLGMLGCDESARTFWRAAVPAPGRADGPAVRSAPPAGAVVSARTGRTPDPASRVRRARRLSARGSIFAPLASSWQRSRPCLFRYGGQEFSVVGAARTPARFQ